MQQAQVNTSTNVNDAPSRICPRQSFPQARTAGDFRCIYKWGVAFVCTSSHLSHLFAPGQVWYIQLHLKILSHLFAPIGCKQMQNHVKHLEKKIFVVKPIGEKQDSPSFTMGKWLVGKIDMFFTDTKLVENNHGLENN